MLIRMRQPYTDDVKIVALVESELLPISPYIMTHEELNQDVLTRLKRGRTFILSALPSSEPLGFIHVMLNGRWMYIDMLAVKSSHKRKGYGARLLLTAENYARRLGCEHAKLLVDDVNQDALLFYMHSGYYMTKHWQETHYYELLKRLDL
ncbi:GNAT family N-acetyltransferase [Paenibacillus guangzhouensis]|uniref:GNAT family N-acetyltransferase n=1 Tax=Paenibacillus guangzhouensis TaxID=1473112 RepID=UPI001266FA87|nr:GNAT family N-acetyltransferase [Paenibacillus guangzhouensis]